MKVGLASDHRGVHIKARLYQCLTNEGFDVVDEGTHTTDAVDYPDYARKVAQHISEGRLDRGVLICGTGIGMAIVANKYPGVRAAPCYDEVMVEMSRRHNDINVLCLPGDLIGERSIDDLVLLWLRTEFESGRHATRIEKIGDVERSTLACDGQSSSASNPATGADTADAVTRPSQDS